MPISTVTINGTFLDNNGSLAGGARIEAILSGPMLDGTEDPPLLILPNTMKARSDENGEWSLELVPSTSVDLLTVGGFWRFKISYSGEHTQRYSVDIDDADGAVQNFTELAIVNGSVVTFPATGAPGSVWRSGVGAPSNGLGVNGDYYLNTATGAGAGDVYLRAGGVYTVVGNIMGPAGVDRFQDLLDVNWATFATGEIPVWDETTGKFVGSVPPSASAPYLMVAGDGSGQYSTIAAALAAVPVGGATVFVKRGTYAGGFTISTAGTRLLGEGNGLVKLEAPLTNAACITVAATDVSIEGIEIDGNRATGATGVGISISNSSDRANITGCYIHDTASHGIYSGGSADVVIRQNRIHNVATNGTTYVAQAVLTGIHIQGSVARGVQIVANDIRGWSQAVGLWYGANHCKVLHNNIIDNYGYSTGAPPSTRAACEDYGETVAGHGYNIWAFNTIDGSTSELIECAMGVVGSSFIGNILRNPNNFSDGVGGGIKVARAVGQETTDITFQGNYFYGHATKMNVVYLAGTARIHFVGNYLIGLANTTTNGAVSVQGGTDYLIEGNTFTGCFGSVTVNTAAHGTQIVNNRITSPITGTQPNISIVLGSYHRIDGNYIHCNGMNTSGIRVAAGAGGGHRITNNTVVGAISYGIDVRQADCLVEGNYIVTTNVFGAVQMDGATALRNIVRGNYCDSNNAARTIYLTNGAAYNDIRENRLIGASATVYLDGTAGVGNRIEPNHTQALIKPSSLKSLGAQTVGTTQTTIAHGLGYAPTVVQVTMTASGSVWKSATSDATNIYLTGSGAGLTCEVYVR